MPSDKLIVSLDGSHTIESQQFGVTYHSKYGSIQETQTVFLDAGYHYLRSLGRAEVSILEMGFGTGLNALMTYLIAEQDNASVNYHTIEAYPISLATAEQLNYPHVLENEDANPTLMGMHQAPSGTTKELSHTFRFTKHITLLEDFQTTQKFDLIYYDAFAPTSQEHLWTPEMMQQIASYCAPEAVLVTYCAKGSFKRALRSAGFTVEGIPGPIGKREMTRATYSGT